MPLPPTEGHAFDYPIATLTGAQFAALAAGAGVVVSVSDDGAGGFVLLSSSDGGATWTPRYTFTGWLYGRYSGILDLVWTGAYFFCVQYNGTTFSLLRSSDGVAWSAVNTSVSGLWIEGTGPANGYIYLYKEGAVYRTDDGVSLAATTGFTDLSVMRIAFGNGVYIAFAQDGIGVDACYSSSNGIDFSPLATAANPTDIVFNQSASKFVLLADGLYFHTSPDGVTWDQPWEIAFGELSSDLGRRCMVASGQITIARTNAAPEGASPEAVVIDHTSGIASKLSDALFQYSSLRVWPGDSDGEFLYADGSTNGSLGLLTFSSIIAQFWTNLFGQFEV